jgi:hypothetical protein
VFCFRVRVEFLLRRELHAAGRADVAAPAGSRRVLVAHVRVELLLRIELGSALLAPNL